MGAGLVGPSANGAVPSRDGFLGAPDTAKHTHARDSKRGASLCALAPRVMFPVGSVVAAALALGVLWCLARSLEARLLALLGARVSGQQSRIA